MENGTKHRILYLYQHLLQHTDAEHPLSTAELMKILKEQYAIKVSRNTISDDLAMLHNCGLHIEHYESTQNKYYYDGHLYDLAELKILVDAISSSKFITQRKSDELITKLLTLTSVANAAKLRRHIYVSGRAKSENEQGYYIVDAIHEAIDTCRKIRLIYADYDVNKECYATNGGSPYTVSPYTLEWDGDYYYLRGFCDERQAVRTFRIDRIAEQPKILNQIAVSLPEDYSPAQYSKCVFRMFDTDQPEEVQLLCHVSTMKHIIDHFGMDVETEPIDEEHFRADILVCTSSTFYRWIFGFNGKMRILGPELVKTAYQEMLRKALEEL
jgi:hypothetical protein ELI_2783